MDDATWERLMAADRLLLYDLLDQAEAAYVAILADRPLTSEAAFGLARVALERGNQALAYQRVKQAVEINPRNDDAQRLYQRLTEILAANPDEPQQRAPAVRPSEQSAFSRNKSMADHLADEERRRGR